MFVLIFVSTMNDLYNIDIYNSELLMVILCT